ncbi:hypothetical protein NL676_012817 [Syzygium grande]|nr:hypothetical protein NL676_012817 [Syzygium grande]
MDRSCNARRFFLRALLFFLSLRARQALSLKRVRALNNTVSAIFVFGDSTVDPGNNNYVRTLFKSDFLPYGRDFANQVPTGRFTNGWLVNDYIVSYIGIKDYVPPYLEPSLSFEDLKTGVSFASAGTGYDPLTAKLSGSWEEGARRIAVPPMGCLPTMITLNSNNTDLQRGCMDQYSSVARDYNALLQKELSSVQSSLATQGSRIYYADIHEPLSDMIKRFPSYGKSLDLTLVLI